MLPFLFFTIRGIKKKIFLFFFFGRSLGAISFFTIFLQLQSTNEI